MKQPFKSISDFVLFTIDKEFEETLSAKGIDGKPLLLDASYEPQLNVRRYGTVIQVPDSLSENIIIHQDPQGFPKYGPRKLDPGTDPRTEGIYSRYGTDYEFEFRKLSHIPLDVRVGDKIYFHFNTLLRDDAKISKRVGDWNGKPMYKVRYDQIICAVRGKKIIPIGSRVLVRPDLESWEDISIKTYYPEHLTGGKKVLRPKEEWLVVKAHPENKPLRGFVAHIGNPLIGHEIPKFKRGSEIRELKVGDHILHTPNADWENNIEGEKYFVMKIKDVMAII